MSELKIVQQVRDDLPEHYVLGADEYDPAPNFGSEETGLFVYITNGEFHIYTESGKFVMATDVWEKAKEKLLRNES